MLPIYNLHDALIEALQGSYHTSYGHMFFCFFLYIYTTCIFYILFYMYTYTIYLRHFLSKNVQKSINVNFQAFKKKIKKNCNFLLSQFPALSSIQLSIYVYYYQFYIVAWCTGLSINIYHFINFRAYVGARGPVPSWLVRTRGVVHCWHQTKY